MLLRNVGAHPKVHTEKQHRHVRFQVITAASMKMAVFWVVVPCSLLEVYQRFRSACCLHHRPDDGGSKHL
jgi:hypothetical protein